MKICTPRAEQCIVPVEKSNAYDYMSTPFQVDILNVLQQSAPPFKQDQSPYSLNLKQ